MQKPVFTQSIPGTSLSFDMISIEGGSFRMGSEDPEALDREKPAHPVTVPSFYMAKYPVTQALWKAVMGNNPSWFQGDQRPVERVSWDNAQVFIKKLNERTGESYRLPTEAEWEYAARGGIYGKGFKYAGSNKLKEVGWYSKNSHGETKPVGLKFPNELGLYDMSGNVWEWCEDVWHDTYKGAPKDGSAWLKGGDQHIRVVRGGSWDVNSGNCRVADRNWSVLDYRFFNIGFRLARS
ncbi:MAG: formylglycine-generating enzyme family protein [Saprospiraceae bacterium]|nr:formylglycine-generating enzyme family protein [Saprospiraceae bacterium]